MPGGQLPPTRTVIKAAPPPAVNPLQFVRFSRSPLCQQAEAQIKITKETKVVKERYKDQEEEWQTSLDSWKNKRKKQTEGVVPKLDEVEQVEMEESLQPKSSRKIKTFSEMIEERRVSRSSCSLLLPESPPPTSAKPPELDDDTSELESIKSDNVSLDEEEPRSASLSLPTALANRADICSADEGYGPEDTPRSGSAIRDTSPRPLSANAQPLFDSTISTLEEGLTFGSSSSKYSPPEKADYSPTQNNLLPSSTNSSVHKSVNEIHLTLQSKDSTRQGFGFTFHPGTVVVDAVIPGGASQQAGLQPGDEVRALNGEAVTGRSHSAVVFALRQAGYTGQLELAVRRPGEHDSSDAAPSSSDSPSRSARSFAEKLALFHNIESHAGAPQTSQKSSNLVRGESLIMKRRSTFEGGSRSNRWSMTDSDSSDSSFWPKPLSKKPPPPIPAKPKMRPFSICSNSEYNVDFTASSLNNESQENFTCKEKLVVLNNSSNVEQLHSDKDADMISTPSTRENFETKEVDADTDKNKNGIRIKEEDFYNLEKSKIITSEIRERNISNFEIESLGLKEHIDLENNVEANGNFSYSPIETAVFISKNEDVNILMNNDDKSDSPSIENKLESNQDMNFINRKIDLETEEDIHLHQSASNLKETSSEKSDKVLETCSNCINEMSSGIETLQKDELLNGLGLELIGESQNEGGCRPYTAEKREEIESDDCAPPQEESQPIQRVEHERSDAASHDILSVEILQTSSDRIKRTPTQESHHFGVQSSDTSLSDSENASQKAVSTNQDSSHDYTILDVTNSTSTQKECLVINGAELDSADQPLNGFEMNQKISNDGCIPETQDSDFPSAESISEEISREFMTIRRNSDKSKPKASLVHQISIEIFETNIDSTGVQTDFPEYDIDEYIEANSVANFASLPNVKNGLEELDRLELLEYENTKCENFSSELRVEDSCKDPKDELRGDFENSTESKFPGEVSSTELYLEREKATSPRSEDEYEEEEEEEVVIKEDDDLVEGEPLSSDSSSPDWEYIPETPESFIVNKVSHPNLEESDHEDSLSEPVKVVELEQPVPPLLPPSTELEEPSVASYTATTDYDEETVKEIVQLRSDSEDDSDLPTDTLSHPLELDNVIELEDLPDYLDSIDSALKEPPKEKPPPPPCIDSSESFADTSEDLSATDLKKKLLRQKSDFFGFDFKESEESDPPPPVAVEELLRAERDLGRQLSRSHLPSIPRMSSLDEAPELEDEVADGLYGNAQEELALSTNNQVHSPLVETIEELISAEEESTEGTLRSDPELYHSANPEESEEGEPSPPSDQPFSVTESSSIEKSSDGYYILTRPDLHSLAAAPRAKLIDQWVKEKSHTFSGTAAPVFPREYWVKPQDSRPPPPPRHRAESAPAPPARSTSGYVRWTYIVEIQPPSSRPCRRCSYPIGRGPAVSAVQHYFHPDCFLCAGCQTSLMESVAAPVQTCGPDFFCGTCYSTLQADMV